MALQKGDYKRTLRLIVNILQNPLLKQFYVENLSEYDWDKAKDRRIFSNMLKVFFAANIMMINFVENPVSFYLQVIYYL